MRQTEITASEVIACVVSLVIMTVGLENLGLLQKYGNDSWYRSGVGLVFGFLGTTAMASFRWVIRRVRAGESVDDEGWAALTWIILSVLWLLGALVWVYAWEAVTGVEFGAGAFLGVLLANAGVAKLLLKSN